MSNTHSSDNRRPESSETNGFSGILMWFVILLILNTIFWRIPKASTKPYSEFIHQVETGQVARVVVGSDQIRYELKAKPNSSQDNASKDDRVQAFLTTPIANDTELPKLLRSHQVEYSATPPNAWGGIAGLLGWLVLPLILFLIGSQFLSRGQGGAGVLSMNRSRARVYSEGSTGVTFANVAGIDEAKAEVQEIVDFLQHADKYAKLGAKIPKGVLLVGPPGTGKTLLAKAIAGEAGVPFFSISGSEFIELFVGIGAARVRDLFDQAKRQAPCIVFIDELDALGKSRAATGSSFGGNDEREQTLNQLLSEMDGFEPNTGVILLAATNRPEVLDPALLRPGRFDRQIMVDRPDKLGREAILDIHATNVRLARDVDLTKLAARTPGFAGADLANLVNEAALLAARNNRDSVIMADFEEAIERILTGLEKKSRVLNDLEQQTVAYHEVGHAIVAALMPGAGSVEKISIVPRGLSALGYTLQLPEEDRFLMVEDEIRGRIATLLGGRSAEEIIMGKVSTGASDDIQKATDLADRFVTVYGMSQELGPIAFDRTQPQILEGMSNTRRPVSSKVSEAIDAEVNQIVDGAHQMALLILSRNHELLEELAQLLLKRETLEGKNLRDRLQQVQAPPELEKWLTTGISKDSLWKFNPNSYRAPNCGVAAALNPELSRSNP
jgi:cell division protease FtsH